MATELLSVPAAKTGLFVLPCYLAVMRIKESSCFGLGCVSVFAWFALTGCAAHVPYGGDESGDGGADSSPDVGDDVTNDVVDDPHVDPLPQCGDERTLVPVPPQPIVNGVGHHDPDVVELSEGQVLGVGALMIFDGPGWGNICTATLVAPTVVLTASHCVLDRWTGMVMAPGDGRFAIGEDVAAAEHMFELESVHPHPDYDPWSGDARADIAVLVLQHTATDVFPGLETTPVGCERVTEDAFVGQIVQNVGYGTIDPNGPGDNTQRWWTTEEVDSLTSFDFVVNGHGESGVCYGDSGGPSLWTMPDGVVRVMGVVSWGDPSCVDYDHYTLAADNCDFLETFLDGCGGVTVSGRCEGQVATYCEGETIIREDCASQDLRCGADDQGRSRCLDGPLPCGGAATYEGECQGNTAHYCEDDMLIWQPCGEQGLVCGDIGGGVHRCTEPVDPCEGETWIGRCQGNRAVFCENDEIIVDRCRRSGLVCGQDRSGAMRCIDPCEGETFLGRCQGNTAIYCDEQVVYTEPCGNLDLVCGEDATGLMRCIESSDPCQGETARGRCEGHTAIYCLDGRLAWDMCDTTYEVCMQNGSGDYRCVSDPCQGLSWEGQCVGHRAEWCEDGELRVRHCDQCGQMCGWSEDFDAYYCTDPLP